VNYGPATNFEIWQIARAATAAPFYFDRLKVKLEDKEAIFEDGGFGKSNNPTIEGIQEIKKLHGKDSVGVVVSVGTARADHVQGTGILHRVRKMGHIATNPDDVHKEVERLLASAQLNETADRFDYFRLNAPGLLNIALDEWKPKSGEKTLEKIRKEFYQWLANTDIQEDLESCARQLVTCRRERALDRHRWEHFAIGSVYRCLGCFDVEGCGAEFKDRGSFLNHLIRDHNLENNDINEEDIRRAPWMEKFKYREQSQSNR
jgi:hypothetical protein